MLGPQQPPCRKGCCQAQAFRRVAVKGGSEECEAVCSKEEYIRGGRGQD